MRCGSAVVAACCQVVDRFRKSPLVGFSKGGYFKSAIETVQVMENKNKGVTNVDEPNETSLTDIRCSKIITVGQ